MKKLLLSLTLCSLFMSTPQQAHAADDTHYGKICFFSALAAIGCGLGAVYCWDQESDYAEKLAALEEELNDLSANEIAILEQNISKFKVAKWVLAALAGTGAVVVAASGYKKLQEVNGEKKKKKEKRKEKREQERELDETIREEEYLNDYKKYKNEEDVSSTPEEDLAADKQKEKPLKECIRQDTIKDDLEKDILYLELTAIEINQKKISSKNTENDIVYYEGEGEDVIAKKAKAENELTKKLLEKTKTTFKEEYLKIKEKIAQHDFLDSKITDKLSELKTLAEREPLPSELDPIEDYDTD